MIVVLIIVSVIPLVNLASIDSLIPERCSRRRCSDSIECMQCTWPVCVVGEEVSVTCTTSPPCPSPQSVTVATKCLQCWQTPSHTHQCDAAVNCTTGKTEWYVTRCRAHPEMPCKGNREFYKNVRCNFSSGHSWARTLFLSVTLGGFGVDRFYLGLWKSAIGKLFSFGGLGIWTIVDVVLIAVGYIQPSDGSLYI